MINSQDDNTSVFSECLITREVPRDYFLDLIHDRVPQVYSETNDKWNTEYKDVKFFINNLLQKAFITASQVK